MPFAPLRLAVIIGLLALPAEAHQLWVEQGEGNAIVYFGELQNNLREVSPGELDDVQPTARLVAPAGARAMPLTKGAAGYTADGRVAAGESLLVEDTYHAIYDRKVGDKTVRTAPTLGARHITDFVAREPAMTLDIVPMGRPGLFKVFFKGKPLGKARIDVVPAAGWMKLLRTDENGVLDVGLPWQGLYYVKVIHHDATPGERPGGRYEAAAYTTTLSFLIKDGLPSPPLPAVTPPAKPGK